MKTPPYRNRTNKPSDDPKMNDWSILEWIVAIAGIATIVGTGYALLRRTGSKANRASASGESARAVQVADSPDSTIVMDSPAAVVVRARTCT